MVPVLHAGTPHRVSLRGFERSHPQLVCVLIREMGSEARASLSSPIIPPLRRPYHPYVPTLHVCVHRHVRRCSSETVSGRERPGLQHVYSSELENKTENTKEKSRTKRMYT